MYHLCMALVEVDAVSKSYPRRAGLRTELRTVVENVSFKIDGRRDAGPGGRVGLGQNDLSRA